MRKNVSRSWFAGFVFGASLVAGPTFALAVGPTVARAAAAAAAIVAGVVNDDAGKPVAGARVTLSGPTAASADTRIDGTFSFANAAAGTYLITVSKPGFATINTTVRASADTPVQTTVSLARDTQSSLREIGRTVTARSSTSLNKSAAAIDTIDTQTYFRRGQGQVSNLLEELPGVELQRFSSGGGPGANTVAAVRGSDPAETQTLIDGHPVSGGPQGSYLIQFLNPLLLSDIEVSKGPGASNSNQIVNAINGSVNFRTPTITSTLSAKASLGYDTYNGSSDSILISDTIGKVGLLAGYAMFGTPGYNTQPVLSVAANGTPGVGVIPEATATTYIGASQTFHNHSELLKLGYNFSNSTNVTLGYLGLHTYADYTSNLTTLEPFKIVGSCPNTDASGNSGPGTGAGCSSNGNSGNPTFTAPGLAGLVGKTVYASATADNLYQGNFETDNEPLFTADFRTTAGPGTFLARYYAASIARDISDPDEAFQPLQCEDPTCNFAAIAAAGDLSGPFFQTQTDYLHGADFTYSLPLGPNTYTASYDTHGDRTTACNGVTASPSGNGCSVPSILQTTNSLSVRGDLHFGSKIGLQIGNYFSHSTFVKSRYDPRVGITFAPNATFVVRAAVGSGFAAPSASVAYALIPHVSRKTLFTGLTASPETSISYDLGGDVRTGGDSKIAVDAYVTRLFNRFTSVTVGPRPGFGGTFDGQPYTRQTFTFNQSDALTKGLELTYEKTPTYGFGTTDYLDFSRAYAGNSNFNFNQIGTVYGNQADGQQFSGYPYTKGRVEFNYRTHDGLRPALGATYYGNVNSFNEPGFVMFDANVEGKLKAGLTLNVSIDNIFNHDSYRTFGQYNYGYAPIQPSGPPVANTLYFAPPRSITVQLSRSIGPTTP